MDPRLQPYLAAGWIVKEQNTHGLVLVAPRVFPRNILALLVIGPLICAPFALLIQFGSIALLMAVVACIGGVVALAAYWLGPRRAILVTADTITEIRA